MAARASAKWQTTAFAEKYKEPIPRAQQTASKVQLVHLVGFLVCRVSEEKVCLFLLYIEEGVDEFFYVESDLHQTSSQAGKSHFAGPRDFLRNRDDGSA
jgi:hypothetical protein